jgi:hypothetical protein
MLNFSDWGIGLAVGAAVAIASHLVLMLAIALPKFPIERGKTWRGTFWGVTTVSAVIGGVAGYLAGFYGGFGGGGTTSPGKATVADTRPADSVPTKPQKVDTAPQKPETYLASVADLYFTRDPQTKMVANFTCEVVQYRWKNKTWNFNEIQQLTGKTLDEFLNQVGHALERLDKEIVPDERGSKRLRVYLDPSPGDLTFDRLRQVAEQRGWKVDRKDVTWRADPPAPPA